MATVVVNNQPVEIGPQERLNCIQAAERAGVDIPAYCYHPALSVVASCRMCLVEVGDRKPDGIIAMQPKLVPGCQTPVKDGTVIVADSEKVLAARKATLEYLLLNHPLDCPTCDQAGECFLQDYSYRHGRGFSRLDEPKNIKPDKDHIGQQITLFTDRCIMCSRCVRFTREISGTAELQIINRGTDSEIDVFPGQPCDNKLAGNVVDLCPVGALCSKDFLYKQRVWWLQSTSSVCPGCSTGCSIHVDQNEDVVYRLTPRENPQAQGHFMCDEGRFGWKYLQSATRLKQPVQKRAGKVVTTDWDSVLNSLRKDLTHIGRTSSSELAVVFSPWMTVEEAYLLGAFVKSIAPQARLGLGPARSDGADDTYPKDIRGQALSPVKFTIRAEKCPNRRGVEAVLSHYSPGGCATLGDILNRAAKHEFEAVYLVGGDPAGWITESQATALSDIKLLVVQDLLPSPAMQHAHYVLPGGSFAEREGTFVNHAGLAQEIHRSVRPPGQARPDGRIFWELAGRQGLYRPKVLREEIAATIPAFKSLASGSLHENGLFLSRDSRQASGVHAP